MSKNMHRKGFSLLELIISTAIASIIVITATNILLHANQASNRIRINNQLFESAQITLSFITEQMSMSMAYILDTEANTNSLRMIEFYRSIHSSVDEAHVITFNRSANQVRFGGFTYGGRAITHTLANNIEDVIIYVESGLMHIEVIAGYYSEIVLTATIDVRHKADRRS